MLASVIQAFVCGIARRICYRYRIGICFWISRAFYKSEGVHRCFAAELRALVGCKKSEGFRTLEDISAQELSSA